MEQKSCIKCLIVKNFSDFPIQKKAKYGLHCWCKICMVLHTKAANKKYHDRYRDEINQGVREKRAKQDPDYLFSIWIRRNYFPHLTNEQAAREYERLLQSQNNVCAICKNPERVIDFRTKKLKRLSVDHCHMTGRVRGLLCADCNQGLGLFKDNRESLRVAITYIGDQDD